MNKALTLEHVVKSYGATRAVDDLSLQLEAGEVYALLGPNGAGKTTTLNLILGFTALDSGRIEIAGKDASSDPLQARAMVGYLPESVMLHPTLTATENLRYFALLAGIELAAPRARELLERAGLQSTAHDRRAAGFSKGMRQKVGIAIALAKNAAVVLLDEPTSGLDAKAASELSQLIAATAAQGIAVLMTTHDLYRVQEVAHRLGILRAGQLVAERQAKSLSPPQLERLYMEQLAA